MVYVPNWFSVDLKTGVSPGSNPWWASVINTASRNRSSLLGFHWTDAHHHVGRERLLRCLGVRQGCWVFKFRWIRPKAYENTRLAVFLTHRCSLYAPPPPIVNLGGLLLQALLEFWPRTRINPMDEEENEVNHGEEVVLNQQAAAAASLLLPVSQWQVCSVSPWECVLASTVNGEQENRVQKGNGYFQVPPHTPVIFGEAGGRTLFRYSWRASSVIKVEFTSWKGSYWPADSF